MGGSRRAEKARAGALGLRRGEVWWADLGAPAGSRPVLLVSRDEAYQVRAYVTVAPVTTRIRGIPVEVPLGPEDGMPRQCVVNLDSLVTVSRSLLERRLVRLSGDKLAAVDEAIRFALDLDSST